MTSLSTPRLLLVDDEVFESVQLRMALADAHVRADLDVFTSVDEARKHIDAATTRIADLILLDLSLKDGSGLDVLQSVRANPANHLVPVVVLSGSTRQEEITLAYAHGANAYVTKPFDHGMLVSFVKTLRSFWFDYARLP